MGSGRSLLGSESPHGIMTKTMDFDIAVSQFELRSRITFGFVKLSFMTYQYFLVIQCRIFFYTYVAYWLLTEPSIRDFKSRVLWHINTFLVIQCQNFFIPMLHIDYLQNLQLGISKIGFYDISILFGYSKPNLFLYICCILTIDRTFN